MEKLLQASSTQALSRYYQQRLAHANSEREAELILTVYNLLNINGANAQKNSVKHR